MNKDNGAITSQSISESLETINSGEIKIRELVAEYQQKIDERNEELNIFLENTTRLFEQKIADLEENQKIGKKITGIEGLPLALKDNFNLVDSVTTASSRSLEDYISPYNATVTQKIIDSNGIIMGKVNLDAFAHGSSTETSDFGTTKNPIDPSRSPGGSSGGSAAAVAANMCVYAIGSETAGSVRGPAAWCGVVGFVPTYGRISRYGLIAMGSSLDRPGVLTRNVTDAAIITDKLTGKDRFDATSLPETASNFEQELKKIPGKMRLGLPKQFLADGIDQEVIERTLETVKLLEKRGFKIVEIDLLDPKYSIAAYTLICRSEVSSNLARIDGIRYGFSSEEKYSESLAQIAHNRGEGFGNEAIQRSMTGAYALSAGYYDAYYKKAMQVRTLIIEDFIKAFEQVDLIVGPTMPTVAPKIGTAAGNPLFGELTDMLTEPSALAGLPCISIPNGFNSEKLPIGFQIFGPQKHEQHVLNLAYTLEGLLS